MYLHSYIFENEGPVVIFKKISKSVHPHQAKEMMDEGTLLIDVREVSEWNHGHAPGALHLPLATLSNNLQHIPLDEVVLVCCRSGSRSSSAVSYLIDNGYKAINVEGGMSAWQSHGLPVVNTKGLRGSIS